MAWFDKASTGVGSPQCDVDTSLSLSIAGSRVTLMLGTGLAVLLGVCVGIVVMCYTLLPVNIPDRWRELYIPIVMCVLCGGLVLYGMVINMLLAANLRPRIVVSPGVVRAGDGIGVHCEVASWKYVRCLRVLIDGYVSSRGDVSADGVVQRKVINFWHECVAEVEDEFALKDGRIEFVVSDDVYPSLSSRPVRVYWEVSAVFRTSWGNEVVLSGVLVVLPFSAGPCVPPQPELESSPVGVSISETQRRNTHAADSSYKRNTRG